MKVEIIEWPRDEARLHAVRAAGAARLILVPDSDVPPVTADPLEDWVRVPTSEADVAARLQILEDRALDAQVPETPALDDDGLLRQGGSWVSLPPVEHRLMRALLDRYQAVVSREGLARSGWPDAVPARNVLDVHIVRLRRRIAPLGLAIRTVRSRGYLLEPAQQPAPSAT